MKNLSVALLAAAALSTSAMANNGFYLGASAGVAQTNAKYDYSSSGAATLAAAAFATPNISDYQRSGRADAGKAAGLFGLFTGYGALVGSGMYVGGEIYGGFDTTNFKPYDDSAGGVRYSFWQAKVERKYYYGLAARFGVMATPSTLIYLRLAAEAGKWKATVTPNATTIDARNSGDANAIASSKVVKTANKSGIQFAPGAGVEVYLNKNLFVRAEYSYLFGPKLTVTQDTSGIANTTLNATSVTHNFKTSQHAMKVGIGYKF